MKTIWQPKCCRGLMIGAALVCLAFPSAAQNSDIFREDAPPAVAPAPRPAPHPRTYSQPEPEVAAPTPPQPPLQPAVAPAPSLPSASQIWAKVRQVAASQSISVPMASNPPFDVAGTPPQYRVLLGAWGPGTWQGNPGGDKAILVVEGVDGGGNIHVMACESEGGWQPGYWAMSTGSIAPGNRFTLNIARRISEYQHGANQSEQVWQMTLRPDGTLAGSRDNGASTVVLQRLQ
jgi:hypothetical protein